MQSLITLWFTLEHHGALLARWKREMAERVMAAPAEDVYAVDA